MPAGRAASIRLDDQTTVNGEVVRVEDDQVLISLPRTAIKTVDGATLPPALIEGVAAPPFSVVDTAGTPQGIRQGQGAVTVLHFWIHWCPHCQTDAPQIKALHERYRENPRVKILTVNLDERRGDLDAFVKERQVTYPVISAAEQKNATGGVDLLALYQISGFPITFLIDAQGIIRRKYTGSFVEMGLPDELAGQIDALLKGSGDAQSPSKKPDRVK